MSEHKTPAGEADAVAHEDRETQQAHDPQLRLCAHGEFIDALHALMRACDDPPADADLIALLERSLESIVKVTDSEMGALMVHEGDGDKLVFALHHGEAAPDGGKWSTVPNNQGIAHWVAQHNRSAVVNNARADPRCAAGAQPGSKTRVQSALAVPVVYGEEVMGVVEVVNKRHGALYAKGDKKRLELICHFDGQLLANLVERHGR